jgi:hypothetical protein
MIDLVGRMRDAIDAELDRNPSAVITLIPLLEWLIATLNRFPAARHEVHEEPLPPFPYPYYRSTADIPHGGPIVPGTTVTFESPMRELFKVRPDVYAAVLRREAGLTNALTTNESET